MCKDYTVKTFILKLIKLRTFPLLLNMKQANHLAKSLFHTSREILLKGNKMLLSVK